MNSRSKSLETDVLVIGGGASGLAAAVQAAELGASVILVEKNAELGGTTARAVGSISASKTVFQRRKGIADTPDAHYDDLAVVAGEHLSRDNLTLRRLYVENAGETVHWLQSHGVAFFGPMPEEPNQFARMHNVLPHSGAYIHWLKRAAEKRGVRILLNTSASALIQNSDAVTGAVCTSDGAPVSIHVARGVILAAGDFSSSVELKTEYINASVARVNGVNPTNTGDGIRLGLEAGGRVVNGDLTLAGPEIRFVVPPRKLLLQRLPPVKLLTLLMTAALRWLPEKLLRPFIMAFATTYLAPSPGLYREGAILVNRKGERFTDESVTPWLDLPLQPNGEGYIILDSRVAQTFRTWPNFVSTAPGVAYSYIDDYRRNRKDIFHEAGTLSELARKVGVPAASLESTVRTSGGPTSAGLSKPPYVALGPVKSWIVLTDGGLATDTELRVLGPNSQPISGLYAAGSNGQGGVILQGHGNHLGWAFVSGRLAAMSAVGRPITGKTHNTQEESTNA